MLVVGKEARALSPLHGIANYAETGQQEKFMFQPISASPLQCRPKLLLSSLRILLTAFLETKTQLWKLM